MKGLIKNPCTLLTIQGEKSAPHKIKNVTNLTLQATKIVTRQNKPKW